MMIPDRMMVITVISKFELVRKLLTLHLLLELSVYWLEHLETQCESWNTNLPDFHEDTQKSVFLTFIYELDGFNSAFCYGQKFGMVRLLYWIRKLFDVLFVSALLFDPRLHMYRNKGTWSYSAGMDTLLCWYTWCMR